MNIAKAIILKLIVALMFAVMNSLARSMGQDVPVGEIVFFRSAFAILPMVLIFAWRHELGKTMHTGRPLGHLGRGLISVGGMFFNFAAVARLPLVEATAISFAAPLITVALAALILKERVRLWRWLAVVLGFQGVIVMLLPHLQSATGPMDGALFGVTAAFFQAGNIIQTRRLTATETTQSIVFYFSITCAIGGLCTLPFGWVVPNGPQLAALVGLGVLGGASHLLLTESYRYAPASVVAPFDYTALLWAFILGFALFGEVPTSLVFVGAAIVAAAGLFVIYSSRSRSASS